MKLTAKQIKCMDEFNADKAANDLTLKVALQFHSNNANEVGKTEREFWDELIELHDLDHLTKYTIKKTDGALFIEPVDAA